LFWIAIAALVLSTVGLYLGTRGAVSLDREGAAAQAQLVAAAIAEGRAAIVCDAAAPALYRRLHCDSDIRLLAAGRLVTVGLTHVDAFSAAAEAIFKNATMRFEF
jgi:hypothetical protein